MVEYAIKQVKRGETFGFVGYVQIINLKRDESEDDQCEGGSHDEHELRGGFVGRGGNWVVIDGLEQIAFPAQDRRYVIYFR